ncbi:protein O-mannosyl-transferase TMTC2-like [Lytechinus variegatus]|uniref:protein O-mannosyl-transferase TMTC2-like n=1 Tax=Lytechinus variegatus TaxID=7654 RepID=UPI001BB26CE0|nr:protein O-mannosyl-transferase TMTC2-like [Lytechinus variegatus]
MFYRRAIIKNQDLRSDTPLTQLLTDDFWGTPIRHSGSHKSYRPLCVLSFRLNYALGELDPFGYHLTNVILHVIATGLFVNVARRFLRGSPSVLFAGLLFASHPIHTEAVAGVVGRADVGACIFTLLSFICYIQSCSSIKLNQKTFDLHDDDDGQTDDHFRRTVARRRVVFLVLSAVMTFCATFTKEQGIMVVAINAAYEIFAVHHMRLRDLPKIFYKADFCHLRQSLLLQATLGGALLGLRFYATGLQPPIFAPADNPASVSPSFLTRTLTFLYLPAYNAWMLMYPKSLSFDWSMESIPLIQTITDLRNLWSIELYVTLAMLGYLCFKELDNLHELTSQSNGRLKHVPCKSDTGGSGSFKYLEHTSLCNGFTQKSNGKETKSLRNGHTKKSPVPAKKENNNSYQRSNGCDIIRKRHSRHCSCSPERCGRRFSRSSSCSSSGSVSYSDDDIVERTRLLNVIIVATSFLIFPFLPATNAFCYVGFVIAERILYIPSIGFCLLLAEGASQIWQRFSGWGRKVLVALVVVQLCLFSVKTVLRNQEWQTEEVLYKAGIEVNPPKALGNLANIYKTAGRIQEAEEAYRRALTYRRNMADVHYNLGVLLQEVGRFEEAIESYQLAIKCRPRMSMAHLNLGIALTTVGRNVEAEAVYRQAATLDDAGLKDPRGQMHGIVSSLFNLGRLLQEANRHEDALVILEDALKRRPDFYPPQSLHNMLGETQHKLGNLQEAERYFKASLRSKPDHVPAHLTYANLLGKTNRAVEAERLLERAVTLEPENANVFRHFGQFWHDQGDYKKASQFYHNALTLQPNDFEITFNLANSLRQAKDNEEAEVYYREAVNLKPNVANGHVNLGAMLHLNGKLEEAQASYLKALSLKPDDPTSLQNLKKLRNLMAKKAQANKQPES